MLARMTSVMWLGINLGAQQRWMKTDTTSRRIRMEQKTGECVWKMILSALAALSLPEVSANQSKFDQVPFEGFFLTVQSVFFQPCCFYQQIGCGNPINTRQTFVDGEIDKTASITQQPWMVSLGKYAKNSYTQWIHECAGSLITEQHVLTSAHCFSNIFNVDEEGQFTTKKRKQFAR